MSERESIVAEQIAHAEYQLNDALHRAEDYKQKAEVQETKARELEGAIRFLRDYQAKLGLGKTMIRITSVPHHGSSTVGIRSLTHQYLVMTTEFSYADLRDYINQYITDPNDRSIRAELSYNKTKGFVERIAPSHYRSLVPGADAGPATSLPVLTELGSGDQDKEDFEDGDPPGLEEY